MKNLVALPKILDVVAMSYDVSVKSICRAKRGSRVKNLPRWIAMKLCHQVGGAKLTEIARAFNVGHYSTVSQTIRRLNLLMCEDDKIAREFNMRYQDLTL